MEKDSRCSGMSGVWVWREGYKYTCVYGVGLSVYVLHGYSRV